MKKSLLLFLILSAALLTGGERIVFSTPGTFHTAWRYIGKIPLIPRTVFSVVPSGNNGNSKLVVEARKSSGMMMQYLNVDLEKTPVMRWRWRVISYPNKADGRKRRRDDQPVAIYIGTDDGAVAKKSIAYRWEGLTPVGYEGKAKYGGGILTVNYIVMRNQDSKAGEWITETRNVAEDFKRIYGQIPEKFAVNVSGNSQYTKSNTVAEIDFIEFIPAPAEK